MSGKIKINLEARKNRLHRRLIGAFSESLGALALLVTATVFTVLFVYGYSVIMSAPYFEIREISVRGVKELTEKDVLALAGIQPHANILSVNTDAVARRIGVNPWIKDIYVGRELPDRLVLDVRERTPVALVNQDGIFYLMDVSGFVFKKLSKGDEVDLAIVTGVNIQDKAQSPLLGDALRLLETLSASGQHAFLGMVSEVHVDEVFGLSILTDKGLHLKLGRENYDGKLRQLHVVSGRPGKTGHEKRSFVC